MTKRKLRSGPLLRAALLPLLAAPAAGLGARAMADPAEVEVAVVELLRSLRDPATDVALSTERLIEFGPPTLGYLLPILEGRVVPAAADGGPQRLSEVQEQVILDACLGIGPPIVLAAVQSRVTMEASSRASAIDVFGAVGDRDDLVAIWRMALPDGDDELDRRVGGSVQRATASIIGRDSEALERLEISWRGLPAPLLPPLIQAVGDAGDARGLELLAGVLELRPEQAALGLAQIRRLPQPITMELGDRLSGEVADLLDSGDPRLAPAAALAAASVGDPSLVPALIEHLEDDGRGLRENSLWALRQLSGRSFPGQREFWDTWYQAELDWYEGKRPRLFRQLDSGLESRVAQAIGELSRHELFRHEVATELARALPRLPLDLACLVCRTLGRLGSVQAVPALVEALEDHRQVLRDEAARALELLGSSPAPRDG